MKKFILSIVILCLFILGYGQQKASTTLFEWNRTDFNPAFSGLSNTTDISILTRQQWLGFDNAPRTQYISGHSYLLTGIGIGGVLYNNVAGPTRQTGVKAAFAKMIKIQGTMKLSMAMSFDIYQNIYDAETFHTGLPNDPAVDQGSTEQKLGPDASVGFVLYDNNYFIGISSTNLTQSKYDFLSTTSNFENPVYRTYYLTGGYCFEINKEFSYNPSLLAKKTVGLPLQLDFCNRFFYKSLISGLSYRSSNELSVLLGVSFAKYYEFAYAFDYSFNTLGAYSKGSHEIALRFKLHNYARGKGRGRNRESLVWAK